MPTCSIYGVSTGGGPIRYIGVTKRGLETRLGGHLKESATSTGTHKRHWLRAALEAGDAIEVEQLDVAPSSDEAMWLERLWITVFRACKVQLTNSVDGGYGILNPTPETRQKISKSRIGIASELVRAGWQCLTDKEREARLRGLSEYRKTHNVPGGKHSEETKALMTARQRERWSKYSPEERAAHGLKTFGATKEVRRERARRAANARWHK